MMVAPWERIVQAWPLLLEIISEFSLPNERLTMRIALGRTLCSPGHDATDPGAMHQKLGGIAMQPVKIKLWGIFRLSRQTYLRLQGAVMIALFCSFALLFFVPDYVQPYRVELEQRVIDDPSDQQAPLALYAFRAVDFGPWIVAGIILLELFETLIVLQRFGVAQRKAASVVDAAVVDTAVVESPSSPVGPVDDSKTSIG
jgi:hypothetical protein